MRLGTHPSPRALAAEATPLSPGILCYGYDPMLLFTRKQILVRLGWTVELASDVDEYRFCVLKRSTVVVICCQTLTPEQIIEAVFFAEELGLPIRFIVMFIRVPPVRGILGCLSLPTEVGPRAFERAVFHLLQASFEDPPAP